MAAVDGLNRWRGGQLEVWSHEAVQATSLTIAQATIAEGSLDATAVDRLTVKIAAHGDPSTTLGGQEVQVVLTSGVVALDQQLRPIAVDAEHA